MAAAQYFDQVQKLYIAYFGRPADPAGLNYWAANIDAAAGNVDGIIDGFAASSESKALYPAGTTTQLVSSIYLALFNRNPEPAGLSYWVQLIDSGTISGARAAYQILNGAGTGDSAAIANKVVAANAFTANVDTSAEISGYSGANAAAIARAFLAKVDATSYSTTNLTNDAITAVVAATGVYTAPAVPIGPMFTATKDGSNAVTFTNSGPGVSVTESGGVYTFTSNGTYAGTSSVAGPISSIMLSPSNATLTIASSVASGITFPNGTIKISDMTSLTATQVLNLHAAHTGLLDITSLASITSASAAQALDILATSNNTTGNAIRTKDFINATTHTAITLTSTTTDGTTLKAIEAATTGLVDASSVTTLTSASVADAQLMLVTNQGNLGDKIKLAGDVAVTLTDTTATGTALKAIDDATTGVVNASNITAITSATVAQAKQLLVTDLTTFSHAANVTVALTDSSATATDLNAIDSSNTGLITAASLNTVSGNIADVKTVLESITGGTQVSAAALNTVTLTDAISANSLDNVVFANNTTLTLANVAGNSLTLVNATVRSGNTLTVNASNVTSGVTVNGAVETDGTLILKGGPGGDTLTGGAGADTLTGGAGADTFVFTTPANSSVTNFDSITDFTSGIDKIKTGVVGGAAFFHQGILYNVATSNPSLQAAIAFSVISGNTSGGNSAVADNIYIISITSNTPIAGTYIFQDTNGDGNAGTGELIIKLTGTSSTTLALSDFIS